MPNKPVKPKHPLCPTCGVRVVVWVSGMSYKCPKCGRFIVKGTPLYVEGMALRLAVDQALGDACGFRCCTDGTICGKFETEECHHPIKSRRVLRRVGWNG